VQVLYFAQKEIMAINTVAKESKRCPFSGLLAPKVPTRPAESIKLFPVFGPVAAHTMRGYLPLQAVTFVN
jgi:hypothetical protein